MAAMVATGELAVLRIIGDLVKRRGCCDRTLAELAARPGLCRTLVQSAIREAGAPGPHAKNDAKARRGPQPVNQGSAARNGRIVAPGGRVKCAAHASRARL